MSKLMLGSVSGAAVYWALLTAIGALLAGAALWEHRRRGKRIGIAHVAGAALIVLGFAALGYNGVGRAFYALERLEGGLALAYHWPSRQIFIPWDSVRSVSTAPGFKGQRPVRVTTQDGHEHLSAMIPVRSALRLSQCLDEEVTRHRTGSTGTASAPDCTL